MFLNKTKKLLKSLKIVFILLFCTVSTFAQKYTFDNKHYTHDVGVFTGVYAMQSDYGQRYNFQSEVGNAAMSISLVHYLTFYNRNDRWNARYRLIDDIAIKTEINYMTTDNLRHHGEYTIGGGPTSNRQKLRDMRGSVNLLNFGVSAEYHFNDLRSFSAYYSEYKWNPYVSLGLMYSMFENDLTTEYGDGDWRSDPTLLYTKWQDWEDRAVGKGSTGSAVLGAGIRYKLTERMDLSALGRFQYFFSDNVDGLNAKDRVENKYNEWLVSFQVGVVWHLNFSDPLRLF